MDRDLQVWLMVFVAVTAISVTIQLAILVAFYYSVRGLQVKVKEIAHRGGFPVSPLQEYSATAREVMASLKSSVNNAAEVSERIKAVVKEATEVSHKHMGRADRMIEDGFSRLEKMSEPFEAGVAKPLREIQAIVVGLRVALDTFFDHYSG
jgi:hypothetical protein